MNLLLFKLFFKSLKKFKNRNKIKRFKNLDENNNKSNDEINIFLIDADN